MVLEQLPELPIDIFSLFELDYIDSCMIDVGIEGDYKYLKNLLKNFEIDGFYTPVVSKKESKTNRDGVDIITRSNGEYHYKDGNIIKELILDVDGDKTDSLTYYEYDENGNCIFEVTRYESVNSCGENYSNYNVFNANGDIVRTYTYGILQEYFYKYDERQNIIECVSEDIIEKYKYNDNNLVVEKIDIKRNATPEQKSTTITNIEYDDDCITITKDSVVVCTIEKNKLQLKYFPNNYKKRKRLNPLPFLFK